MSGSSNSSIYTVIPRLGRLREQVLYGDVWKQPELNQRDCSIVTCSVLAALGKTDELKHHMALAIKNGVTVDELLGLVVQLGFYAEWPCAVNAGLHLFESDIRGEGS